MADDTTILTKTTNGITVAHDSAVFGVSVRAWIAIILVLTICVSYLAVVIGVVFDAVKTKDWSRVGTFANVGEPLYSMSVAALGFYFGQKTNKP